MVSARLTVVPQMALISSGSSEGAAGAERLGAEFDIGTSRWVPSELRLSGSAFLTEGRRARRADAVGVMEKDEWMSPRRFFGVFVTNGLLRDSIRFRSMLMMCDTYDGKSRGSESTGPSEAGNSTRLRGVFTGEELGNAIGDELPAINALVHRAG